MSGDVDELDEPEAPRESWGGRVDGSVAAHLGRFLAPGAVQPADDVPVTLGGFGGPVVGSAHVESTPDGVTVLARVTEWLAERIAPTGDLSIGRVDCALASPALGSVVKRVQSLEERERTGRTLWGIPVVENDLVPDGVMYLVGPDALRGSPIEFDPLDDDPSRLLRDTRRAVVAERVYQREPIRFEVDTFGSDYLRFMAEERLAFTLWHPRRRSRWTPARQTAARTEYRRKTRHRNRRRHR